jgi:hypothetical protein
VTSWVTVSFSRRTLIHGVSSLSQEEEFQVTFGFQSSLTSNTVIGTKVKGKGKVVPVLFSTEHHATKAYCGSGGINPLFLLPLQ